MRAKYSLTVPAVECRPRGSTRTSYHGPLNRDVDSKPPNGLNTVFFEIKRASATASATRWGGSVITFWLEFLTISFEGREKKSNGFHPTLKLALKQLGFVADQSRGV